MSLGESKFQYNPNIPLLIAGFGNPLMLDEGAGITAIQRLNEYTFPPNIILEDGGTMGIGAISLLQDYQQVIIIDCVQTNLPEKPYIVFNIDEVEINHPDSILSAHDLNLNSCLVLMQTMKMPIPNILVYGINPEKIDYGMGLSDNVEKSVSVVVKDILDFFNIDIKAT